MIDATSKGGLRLSPQRRQAVIDALRNGTVPQRGLDVLAVGLDTLQPTMLEELEQVRSGSAKFKALRGEYGTGKTFFSRWLTEQAKQRGFATAEVQISETETPLHKLETVYRRLMERLATSDTTTGALGNLVDGWFFALEQDVVRAHPQLEDNEDDLATAIDALMEQRLAKLADRAPMFALALRGYRKALHAGDSAAAQSLTAWLSGQPNVSAAHKRAAGIKGEIDHYGALGFVEGLLTVLKDSGRAGLVLVLDEVETVQRMRSDVRDKSLNAVRQLMDEIDGGRFPGLYVLMTGTAAFFEGPRGVARLEPLAQRLSVDFATDAKFDNPRAVQIRLQAFDRERLLAVGRRVRDVYAAGASAPERVAAHVGDGYLAELADAVAGRLGGKTGIAPRIFLKKLVGEVLDRVDQFEDFDPKRDYQLTVNDQELSDAERAGRPVDSIDDIELDV